MKNNNIKIPLLFFILVYLNQGLSSLPNLSLFFLMKEEWMLSATTITSVGFITGFAWYVKFIMGWCQDRFPILGYHSKYYLIFNYFIMLLGCMLIGIFGLNLTTLIISGVILNFATANSDVANDKQMVILEQKHNLSGKLQALQWTAMGVGGLVVSLLGAWIASTFASPVNYKIAYGLSAIVPIITLFYLFVHYKEKKVAKDFKPTSLKGNWEFLKDKAFLFGLSFIACLNFAPSFGVGLSFQMRDVLHIDKMFMGWLGAMGTVLGLVGYIIYYVKAHKFPLRKMLYFTVIFSAITNLFYLYIPNQWFIMAYSVLFGAFGGVCFLALMSYMAKIVPAGNEGMFYAIVVSVNNLSAQLGNVIGGRLYDAYGYNVNVIVATGATLLCLFFIPKLRIEEDNEN